jgi:leucyl-tRNA synthetase
LAKSKGNVVDPHYLIESTVPTRHGFSAIFASPPERDLDWSDQGVEGVPLPPRVWRLVDDRADSLAAGRRSNSFPGAAEMRNAHP